MNIVKLDIKYQTTAFHRTNFALMCHFCYLKGQSYTENINFNIIFFPLCRKKNINVTAKQACHLLLNSLASQYVCVYTACSLLADWLFCGSCQQSWFPVRPDFSRWPVSTKQHYTIIMFFTHYQGPLLLWQANRSLSTWLFVHVCVCP